MTFDKRCEWRYMGEDPTGDSLFPVLIEWWPTDTTGKMIRCDNPMQVQLIAELLEEAGYVWRGTNPITGH